LLGNAAVGVLAIDVDVTQYDYTSRRCRDTRGK
jgi:hypothetical protein